MRQLPGQLEAFVEQQETRPVSELVGESDPSYPYSEYYYRAVIAMLLSGRVASRFDGYANGTDANRICKEANFEQYWFPVFSEFLVNAEVVQPVDYGGFQRGPNLDGFLANDSEALKRLTRLAFLRLASGESDFRSWRAVDDLGQIELMTLFFACFRDLAIPSEKVGQVLRSFCVLPREELLKGCRALELESDCSWADWLDEKGQRTITDALFEAGWASAAEQRNWMYLNHRGRVMLGLGKPPARPEPIVEFRALPNFCVFAGSDLSMDTLVPLFRFCKIVRIDRIFEFKIEKKRLKDTPAKPEICDDLPTALKPLDPLPDTIRKILEAKSDLKGSVQFRQCGAIIKPETPALLDAIRTHPKLKNYIEPGAPKGYLLIRYSSDPVNFVHRCRSLGIQIELL